MHLNINELIFKVGAGGAHWYIKFKVASTQYAIKNVFQDCRIIIASNEHDNEVSQSNLGYHEDFQKKIATVTKV